MGHTKRNYKDTVFRMIFGNNKKELLTLFNAVNGTDYQNPDDLKVKTLKNAIYLSMKNDVSFLLQDYLSLYEHQSTLNPNLPLRDLFYAANMLHKQIRNKDLYTRKRLMIPVPRFVMFYNGEEDLDGVTEYRLSELYRKSEENPQLELVVRIVNINAGQQNAVMDGCPTLREYAEFVKIIREYKKKYTDLDKAVREAVDDCIENGILADFLKENRDMAYFSCLYEFDAKKHDETMREEGREESREKIEALEAENESLTSENESLTSENASLTYENESLTSENRYLNSKIELLQAKLAKI
ncbi:MAG: hypothetical protein IJT05_08810 [Lachnospiraceae bacterium]|nr:hypothetical protein [Lachnospiraceae bacterium]